MSNTLLGNFSCKPAVALNTPPFFPISSPSNNTLGSEFSACSNDALIALIKLIETFKQRFSNNTHIFLVQIGANDGVMADPVHTLIKTESRISACLIEPQKEEFQKLYGDKTIVEPIEI